MRTALLYIGILILLALYIYGVLYFRKHRVWLTYYLVAAFGLVMILVLGLKFSGLEKHIEFAEMAVVRVLAAPLGIGTAALGPQTIQVNDAAGWVVLTMGVESSALIELSILIGLVVFYPAFTWQKKLRYLGIGLVVTFVANIMRVLIIVSMTHFMGRETIFISHAIVGRMFFFSVVIVLFWYILTRPTVDEVSKIVRGVS